MRKWRQPHLATLQKDINSVLVEGAIRKAAVRILRQMGLKPPPPELPLLPPRSRRKDPSLRVATIDGEPAKD
jgi:hypothetical protein